MFKLALSFLSIAPLRDVAHPPRLGGQKQTKRGVWGSSPDGETWGEDPRWGVKLGGRSPPAEIEILKNGISWLQKLTTEKYDLVEIY